MTTFSSLGKLLIIAGCILLLIGVIMIFFDKIPFLGKLPGDIAIRKKNMTIYFPIVTSILLSIFLTIILNIIRRR